MNKMRKRKICLAILGLILGCATYAQSAFVATGGTAYNIEGATIGVSVGQLGVETVTNGSGYMYLGIQQDYSVVEAVATKPISDIVVPINGYAGVIKLTDYFISTSTLEFTVSSSNESCVSPVLDGENLSLSLVNEGIATITVVATTPKGKDAELSFFVTVDEEDPTINFTEQKLRVIQLFGEASVLLANVENPSDLSGQKLLVYDALQAAVQDAQLLFANTSAGVYEYSTEENRLISAIDDFKREMNPTAVDEFENIPQISVIERTIYISNMNGLACNIYDIAGKCVYSCKDMMTAMVSMRVAGAYVIKIGDKQYKVVLK